MSTAVQITLIICVTIVATLYILASVSNDSNNNKKK